MGIKGEANLFKFKTDFAKNLKQFAKTISFTLLKINMKKTVIVDKHTNIIINVGGSGQVAPEQIKEITEKASKLLERQAKIIGASEDKVFDPLVWKGITSSVATYGTAKMLLDKNIVYLMKNKGHPTFIEDFSNLACSLQVVAPKPKRCSVCGKMYHPTIGELASPFPTFDICERCRRKK